MNTIAYEFLKLGSDESSRLGLIQTETPRQPLLGKKAELYEELNMKYVGRSGYNT
jgi:hypothetical protein